MLDSSQFFTAVFWIDRLFFVGFKVRLWFASLSLICSPFVMQLGMEYEDDVCKASGTKSSMLVKLIR
jgi:hypothetical protein